VRKELHDHFGGGREGGISPSARTPNIFLFTDPPVGRLHGYFDGWGQDGYFHYSGEGQRGDQRMIRGNRAVRDHHIDGRSPVVSWISRLRGISRRVRQRPDATLVRE
jgi:hypothetical protein